MMEQCVRVSRCGRFLAAAGLSGVLLAECASGASTNFFSTNLITASDWMYVPTSQVPETIGGVTLSNMAYRVFDASAVPPDPGSPVTYTFNATAEMELSVDGGTTYGSCVADAVFRLSVAYLGADSGCIVYGMEVLDLGVSGGGLPAGVLFRESPTKTSSGSIRIKAIPGGYEIGSFFDVWMEVSTDGGGSWTPAGQSSHKELRVDPKSIAAMTSQSQLLEPPIGNHVSAEGRDQSYACGIKIKGIRHKLFTHHIEPPALGQSVTHEFDSQVDMLVSYDGGSTFAPARVPASTAVKITRTRDFQGCGTFETEILSMNLAGGDLASGVLFRESPTLMSNGGICITPAVMTDGIMVSSFFDIYTEVSTDGGMSWGPAVNGPIRAEARAVAGVNTFANDRVLPPLGDYASPGGHSVRFPGGVIAEGMHVRRPTQSYPPPASGGSEVHSPNVTVVMNLSVDGGLSFTRVSAPAAQTFSIASTTNSGSVRYFDTEMLALDISGGSLPRGVMIRENPARASLGRTGIRSLVSGEARIDSFFDVFLEVSTDDGGTWSPSSSGPVPLLLGYLEPLSIEAPPDMTVWADGSGSATVTYPAPTVTGGRAPVVVTCIPPSGSVFPVGVTVVACTATDSASQIATDSFTVTVRPYRQPPEIFFVTNNLPPLPGVYVSASTWFQAYASGIVIADLQLREFSDSFPPPAGSETRTVGATAEIRYSIDGGVTWVPETVPATLVMRTTHTHDSGGTSFYDTEMLSLTLSASEGAIIVREVPTLPSIGRTTIRPVTGGYMLGSFFDVWTEVSTDGGLTWSPCADGGPLELRCDPMPLDPVSAPTALFPPPNDHYLCTSDYFLAVPAGVVFRDVRCLLPTFSTDLPAHGTTNIFSFDAELFFNRSFDGGSSWTPGSSPAQITISIARVGAIGGELYHVEILDLKVSGGDLPPGEMIRESPTQPSLGEARVTAMPDGTFLFRSFFDLFVEMSQDGGATWAPSATRPARMELRAGDPEDQFPSPNLPPLSGAYAGTEPWFAMYANGVIISNFVVRHFTSTFAPPSPSGSPTVTSFGSTVDMMIYTPISGVFSPFSALGSSDVKTANLTDHAATRYFDTEMLSLDIAGGSLPAGWMIRESPTRRSLGRTSVTDPTLRPPYQVSSFFDVWTEISTDGGLHWYPALNGPSRIALETQDVEVDYFEYAMGRITLRHQDNSTEDVVLSGTATFAVTIDPVGRAEDTDSDGLDQVRAEMTSLDLYGHSTLGAVHVTLDSRRPTLGEIEETANNNTGKLDVPPFAATGSADSFFDVFFRIEIGAEVLFGDTASHMTATLSHKPPAPGETYEDEEKTPIALVYADGKPSGFVLDREHITPNIDREVDGFPEALARVVVNLPGTGDETVILVGTSRFEVAIQPTGEAADTDGDGLDEARARMTVLDLRGNSSIGPVRLTLDPARLTVGEIEELVNNTAGKLDVPPFTATGAASSFFDIYFRLEIGGKVLVGLTAANVRATLTHKPPAPGETYLTQQGRAIVLVDTNGEPSSITLQPQAFTPNPFLEVDTFQNARVRLTLQLPGGGTETVNLRGPVVEHVFVGPSGESEDWDSDGLDQVVSRIAAMNVTGNGSMGLVRLTVDPERPTIGQVEERANNSAGTLDIPPFALTGSADSFFDVFYRLEIDGAVLFGEGPARIKAVTSFKPPTFGETYVTFGEVSVSLVDTGGVFSSYTIEGEEYTPVPLVGVDVFPEALARVELTHAVGAPERLVLVGTATIQVLTTPEGAAGDSNGNGRDDAAAKIMAMDLRGNNASGPVRMTLDPGHSTTGRLEELVNNTMGTLDIPPFKTVGSADSFFDVFFQLEMNGTVSYGQTSVRLQTVLSHTPPALGETYRTWPETTVALVDGEGIPTGTVLTNATFTPNPFIEVDAFPVSSAALQLLDHLGYTNMIDLSGSSEVHVYIDPAGAATDTDSDGRDQVTSRLFAMDMWGSCPLGPVHVTLNPDRVSLGEIEEQANNTPGTLDVPPFTATGIADSFFDAFLRIDVGTHVLRNLQGLPLSAVIAHKPPAVGETYTTQSGVPMLIVDSHGDSFYILYMGSTPNTPVLAISNAPPQGLCISWPAPSEGYLLQLNTNLTQGSAWTNVSLPVITVGDRKCSYTNPPAGNGAFRLRHPLP